MYCLLFLLYGWIVEDCFFRENFIDISWFRSYLGKGVSLERDGVFMVFFCFIEFFLSFLSFLVVLRIVVFWGFC